jgi:N-acyl-D-amino-acid deacylase
MDTYDVVIRNGTLYNGSGKEPVTGGVAIQGDTLSIVGDVSAVRGRMEIDAQGMAVAPGFINMLSHAQNALLVDGRSQSDIRQGVTLEVMGEGMAAQGPLNDALKAERLAQQGDIKYDIAWTTLGEYLDHVAGRGVACNVASFVSSSIVRANVLGYASRAPTAGELDQMRALVRQAMEEGAVGISSSLIYAPDCYADTHELIALARVVGEYKGLYISHIRSEGSRFLEALDELITICREAECAAEIYHFKVSGRAYWHKLADGIARVETARAAGMRITADMYNYIASSTSLASNFPAWAHEGGRLALLARLKDPATRERIKQEMAVTGGEWESHLAAAGPENIMLAGCRSEKLKALMGMTLSQITAARGKPAGGTPPVSRTAVPATGGRGPAGGTPPVSRTAVRATGGRGPADETLIDLVLEDEGSPLLSAIYFKMSEENVRRQIALPWVSFGSDSPSIAAEGVFLQSHPHPRAYGNFARLLQKYVREEKIITLAEAIRRLTTLPAGNLKLHRRGALRPGSFADVVVFDPAQIQEHTTFEQPHRYASGMCHVFVNGVQVLRDGEHTGALPGRVVRGPGWTGRNIET